VTPAAVSPGNLREDAALLAARGDYAGAERTYRQALRAQPDDVDLHFGLGSVLSQLDRRPEAMVAFRFVVKHGRPGRPEVDSARRWLAETEAAAGGTERTSGAVTTAAAAPDPGSTGSVLGKLTWPGVPSQKQFPIRILLERDGQIRKSTRSRLNSSYALTDVPEGTYNLIGLAGNERIWSDVSVTVVAGRETALDLSPANARVAASEFQAR
jgi:hypothetical protein